MQYSQKDINEYVNRKLHIDNVKPIKARKIATIKARQLNEAEEIKTILSNGRIETPDGEKPQQGDWIIKNPDGEEYVNSDKFFHNNYESKGITVTEKDNISGELKTWGLFEPKGQEKYFIQIDEDMLLEASWATQDLLAGAYINITDRTDIYGIDEDIFNETYERL